MQSDKWKISVVQISINYVYLLCFEYLLRAVPFKSVVGGGGGGGEERKIIKNLTPPPPPSFQKS